MPGKDTEHFPKVFNAGSSPVSGSINRNSIMILRDIDMFDILVHVVYSGLRFGSAKITKLRPEGLPDHKIGK